MGVFALWLAGGRMHVRFPRLILQRALDWYRYIAGPGPGRVGIEPLPKLVGDQVDADPARPRVQVAENAFAIGQSTQCRLVVVGWLYAEQGHDVGDLGSLR